MNKLLTGGIVVALALSGLAFFAPSETITERVIERVGAQVGPDHYETQYFKGGFVIGDGSYATSSTASAYTLTRTEVDSDVPYVAWNAGLNVAVTFPNATSSPFSSMRIGERFDQYWYSATTTAATTITFTAPAGNGIDLQEPELDGTVILNGLEFAKVTYIKTGASTVSVITDITQVGD